MIGAGLGETAGRNTLKREMSGLGGMIITLTGLSPSIGVFVAAPVVIQQSGSFVVAALCLAFLLGLVMCGVYAELGSAMPHAGGDYVLIGRTLGPAAGFANLATSMVGFPAALALSALGVADFLQIAWPAIPHLPTALASIVVVLVLAALSVRLNAWVTGAFLAIELLTVIATGVIGFLHPHQNLIQVVVHPVMGGPGGHLIAPPLLAMGVAGAAAVYTLNGYGGAVSFGEEVVGARRKMIWMIYGALAIGAVTIILPLAGVIAGTRDLAALSASPTPLQDFVRSAAGPRGAAAIGVGVAIAIFNAMIAVALGGGRVVYAAARDGAWHPRLNALLGIVHGRFGSPWPATSILGAAGLVLCLLPLPVLVLINGSGASVSYGLLALGVIVGRRNGATARSQARMPLHPVGPVLVILAALALVAAGLMAGGAGLAGMAATLAVLALGALYYLLVVRPAGAWAHRDPAEEAAR